MNPSYDNSVGGDIILNNDAAQNQKKPLLWVGLGILLIAGIVLAFFLISTSGGRSQGVFSNNIHSSYNSYLNYLLYGTQSTEDVRTNYDDTTFYAVEKSLYENDDSYFNNLETYWKDFISSEKLEEFINDNPSLEGRIEWQSKLMEFLLARVGLGDISEENILDSYMNNGSQETIQLINDKLAAFSDLEYEYAEDYSDAIKSYIQSMIDVYSEYDMADCIVVENKTLDKNCVNNLKLSTKALSAYIENIDNDDLNIANSALLSLIENGILISDEINDRSNDE